MHVKDYDCMHVRCTLLKPTPKVFGVPHMKHSQEHEASRDKGNGISEMTRNKKIILQHYIISCNDN